VVVYNGNSGEIEEDLKQTLGEYIEKIRDSLLTNKLIYEDELGLVSVQ
jgi:hypothetical protein